MRVDYASLSQLGELSTDGFDLQPKAFAYVSSRHGQIDHWTGTLRRVEPFPHRQKKACNPLACGLLAQIDSLVAATE